VIVVYNPLAWKREEVIRIPVGIFNGILFYFLLGI
jgi:hypothetical protein